MRAMHTWPRAPFDQGYGGIANRCWCDVLLRHYKVHYNRCVRAFPSFGHVVLAVILLFPAQSFRAGQEAPAASGARILLLPRKLVAGEHATLAVLDVAGRLTPNVNVIFSNGDKVTTDETGRALFVAPLNVGKIYASIEGRSGRVSSTIVAPSDVPWSTEEVTEAPHIASISDRFEFLGHGFCGDADANHVTIANLPGLVLASSPGSLTVLPPTDMDPGPAEVKANCGQKSADPFTIIFVALELEASGAPLAPGEHRELTVRVRGTTAKVGLEARNLAPDVADLNGGLSVKEQSSGGPDNVGRFELVGKKHGNFTVSIRLLTPLSRPRLGEKS
jgi:hypothetical protein